jgi:hypothetical protein
VDFGGGLNLQENRITYAVITVFSLTLAFTHSQGIPFDPDDAMFNPPIQRRAPSSTGNYPVEPQVRETFPRAFSLTYESLGLTQPSAQLLTYQSTQPHYPFGRGYSTPFPGVQNWARQCRIVGGGSYLYKAGGDEGEGDRYQGKFCSARDRARIYYSQEFYTRCRASQELVFAQIPWATSSAERSRNNRAASGDPIDRGEPNVLDLSKDPSELTVEEQLLAALLISNEELVESLRMYDDWERVGFETDVDQWSQSDGVKRPTKV